MRHVLSVSHQQSAGLDGPKFMDGLTYGLDFTQKHGGSVQVTGGEPSLSRRLPAVLAEVGKRSFHRKVVNSNGSGFSIGGVDELVKAGITHVNLSRHHYVEHRNQEVMRFSHAEWGTNERFIKAVRMIHAAGILVRVNCNLLAAYIDSAVEMSRFIEWCESFRVYNVSFSETFPLDVFEYNLPIVPGYADAHAVDLAMLVAELDSMLGAVRESPEYLSSSWSQSQWISSFVVGGHRRFLNTEAGGRISIKTLAGWQPDGLPNLPVYSKAVDAELRTGTILRCGASRRNCICIMGQARKDSIYAAGS